MIAVLNYLESATALDSLFSESFNRPVVLLKHSSSCGISAHILDQLSAGVDYEINVIVVQTHRNLSNDVADRTGHRHHSPQIFVIANGKAIYHATHYGINCDAVNSHIPAIKAKAA